MWEQPPRLFGGAQRRHLGRTLLSVAVDVDFDLGCHPEEAESHAKRATPDEEPALSLPKGPVQLAGSRLTISKKPQQALKGRGFEPRHKNH